MTSAPIFIESSASPHIQTQLEALALQCNLALLDSPATVPDQALIVCEYNGMLAVRRNGQKEHPVLVDFVGGKANHRRQFGGGKGQDIAKAIGLNKGMKPTVLDATGGLGQDAFVLTCLGCSITLIERSAIIAALLQDGIYRAQQQEVTHSIATQMQLIQGNAVDIMPTLTEKPDVIYLDPMFPHREKSALVKKEMRLFQDLLSEQHDADALLPPALALATYRVVVKRPKGAPNLNNQAPTYRLEGKSCRYDIYALKAFT